MVSSNIRGHAPANQPACEGLSVRGAGGKRVSQNISRPTKRTQQPHAAPEQRSPAKAAPKYLPGDTSIADSGMPAGGGVSGGCVRARLEMLAVHTNSLAVAAALAASLAFFPALRRKTRCLWHTEQITLST